MSAADLARRIKAFNPNATPTDIARAIGVSKQAVWQALQPTAVEMRPAYSWPYENAVAYVRKVIPQRGRLWEGARPAFESGEYADENIARFLREGVIVPSSDPEGGYVLPEMEAERRTRTERE